MPKETTKSRCVVNRTKTGGVLIHQNTSVYPSFVIVEVDNETGRIKVLIPYEHASKVTVEERTKEGGLRIRK
jgi:hypothetical protein